MALGSEMAHAERRALFATVRFLDAKQGTIISLRSVSTPVQGDGEARPDVARREVGTLGISNRNKLRAGLYLPRP